VQYSAHRYVAILIILFARVTYGQDAAPLQPHSVETMASFTAHQTQFSTAPLFISDQQYFLGYRGVGRLVWRGGHLVGVGIQSGYSHFSEQTLSGDSGRVAVQLSSIPIEFIVDMQAGNVEFGAGLGFHVLRSQFVTNAISINRTGHEIGISSWCSYRIPLVPDLWLAPEAALQVLSNRGIVTFGIGISLHTTIVRY
jgi:hypothetical protein